MMATETQSEAPATGTSARRRAVGAWIALPVILVVAIVAATSIGPVSVPWSHTLAVLLGPLAPHLEWAGVPQNVPASQAILLTGVRLPRVLLACLVGAGLSVAGATMQAVFGNPLAEPGITGVSAGGAVGAVLVITTGLAATAGWLLPVAAFIGSILTVIAAQLVAGFDRRGTPATLLLVGIAFNALLGAVISAALANAPDIDNVRRALFWLNGDLTGASWHAVVVAGVGTVVGGAVLVVFARELDLMLLPDDIAASTGMRIVLVRQGLLAVAALVTAAAVSVTGTISFVGLVVPHLVRLVIGPGHRRLLPIAAVTGGVFLILADLGARMLFTPVTLQTGTVTAFIGAPVLLVLVLRARTREGR